MASSTSEGFLTFEASARLQRLFGRDLLPDEFSAVEELVKNAYDSDATKVTITIVRASGDQQGEIEMHDNGVGMSLSDFRRVWMWAGYSEKKAAPLPRTRRIPVGEKGIGRFAADKLGDHLTVITKPQDSRRALRVEFDWSKFGNQRKRLSEINIPYEHIEDPLLTADMSGTILRISKLRDGWDDKSIEQLRGRLARLLNPYERGQRFSIVLNAPKVKLSGQIVPDEIENADFEWTVTRLASGRTKVRRRRQLAADGAREWGEWETLDASGDGKASADAEFGPLRARFLYFIERPKKAEIGNNVSGVGVYRDGLRVEPAGSSAADWLGLLEKRAKRAGHMPLVPSRLFGFVEISRSHNPKLQDATNRRAFVTGPAFEGFTDFLKGKLREFETQVEKEVSEPRWERSKQVNSQKLIQARYQTLTLLSLGLAHELRQSLQSIQTASENIRDYLDQVKQRVPQVQEAVAVIQRSVDRVEKHIQFLQEIGSGKEETELINVNGVISTVLDAFREQAAARNISLRSTGLSPTLDFNRSVLLTSLTNMILNAYQAIESLNGDASSYHIDVRVDDAGDSVRIFVEDDGPGVPESMRTRLFRRPATSKQGSMGVALIIWRDALRMFGGDLSCESFSNPTRFVVTLPKRASNGKNIDR